MTQKERNFWKKYIAKEKKRAARARALFLRTFSEEDFKEVREYWQKIDPIAFQRQAR